MSWLLDTDVLSQPVKAMGNAAVVQWLREERAECYTSTVVVAQVAYWIRSKEGAARQRLQRWFTAALVAMEGRILSFNSATAHVWAEQKVLL